jgi:hypothetical protein
MHSTGLSLYCTVFHCLSLLIWLQGNLEDFSLNHQKENKLQKIKDSLANQEGIFKYNL